MAPMHIALAPGETLLPGTREALDALFAREEVEAVLVPLVPRGDDALQRAARRYLAAWDRRYLHPQNFFAPACRVATRAPLAGWRNADAAPMLADALAQGRRIEALDGEAARDGPSKGVSSPLGDDLAAWIAHFRDEGSAWGALARRDARFRPYLPALSRGKWWRHNVLQAGRRTIEIIEAVRAPAPIVLLLHLARESAFGAGCADRRTRED